MMWKANKISNEQLYNLLINLCETFPAAQWNPPTLDMSYIIKKFCIITTHVIYI